MLRYYVRGCFWGGLEDDGIWIWRGWEVWVRCHFGGFFFFDWEEEKGVGGVKGDQRRLKWTFGFLGAWE